MLILMDSTCFVLASPGEVGLLKSESLGHLLELLASVLSIYVFPGLLKGFCTSVGLLFTCWCIWVAGRGGEWIEKGLLLLFY